MGVVIPEDIAKRAADFVGRAWVLDEVIDWMDHREERFFLVTGEPGSGKTALAAWLAGAGPSAEGAGVSRKLVRIRDRWRAVHFCVARGSGTLDPVSFAESLARQLSDQYEEYAVAAIQRIAPEVNIFQEVRENWGNVIGAQISNLIVGATNAQSIYNRAVGEPLKELSRHQPDLRVFILVDALDEALTFTDRINIVTLLAHSNDLPTGVRFLVTTRNDFRVIRQFDQRRRLDISDPEHTHDTDADVRAYVQHQLPKEETKQPLASTISSQRVEDAILQHAAGNFLYVEFLLNEIAGGKRSPEDLAGLPRGLYGLYGSFLDRLVPEMSQGIESQRWGEEYQPLLGSLSVSSPAAPEDILPRWLEFSEDKVERLLNDVIQVTEEHTFEDGFGYRLYHASMAEYLASRRYRENGTDIRNLYYTPTREQHERIVHYYLSRFGNDRERWEDCDRYGLRQLVGHMQAYFDLADTSAEREQQAQAVYAVVLDEKFRDAQREKLGDAHATLSDLQTALNIALARDDLVKVLECIGTYRDTIRGRSIAEAVFEAVKQEDFERAMQQAGHYGISPNPRGNWTQILQLYLAWEAAEQGGVEAAQKVIASSERLTYFWGNELRDALLVRIARTLSRATDDTRDARSWLVQLGMGQNADFLLARYDLAQPLDPDRRQVRALELHRQLTDFGKLVAEGDPEAVSGGPFLDPERMGRQAAGLQGLLTELAAEGEGQAAIDQALDLILPNPYPRYRDIGLVALGVACLSVPDPSWVRPRLQSILQTALDQEGVTFTFDLPSILLEEGARRRLPTHQLSDYLAPALRIPDVWGSAMRAHSARAAALFRQGNTTEALATLRESSRWPSGFAGYGTLAFLSLLNRCYEFEEPGLIDELIWGPNRTSLFDAAQQVASNVRDTSFREERLKLVEDFRGWAMGDIPNVDSVLGALSEMPDPDGRRVYKDHATARWASLSGHNREGLKKLVPMALADATTLDAILGRLFGLNLDDLSNDDLADAIRLCATYFMAERPWERWSAVVP